MKIRTQGLSEIVLEVQNMKRAVAFWSEKLGFPIVEQWGYSEGQFDESADEVWATWLYLGGPTRLGLWLPRRFNHIEIQEKSKPVSSSEGLFDEGGSHVHFALSINKEELESLYKVLNEEEIDYKVITEDDEVRVYLKDTENNIVEFYTLDMKSDYLKRMNGINGH